MLAAALSALSFSPRVGPHPHRTALSALTPRCCLHMRLSLSPSPDAPALSAQSPVVLATFDGSATDHKWHVTNDPVMGGQSKSTFAVEDGVGKFSGKCAVVPFLKAPDANPHPKPFSC